jgi:cyclase
MAFEKGLQEVGDGLTEEMLRAMREAVPAAAQIGTLVNTHANGDHCYGNQLVQGARIVASQNTAQEMGELPPAVMAALVEQAPNMGELGAFFLRCFGAFDFTGIELKLPEETFVGELSLKVATIFYIYMGRLVRVTRRA